jgi:hypothetical protein
VARGCWGVGRLDGGRPMGWQRKAMDRMEGWR